MKNVIEIASYPKCGNTWLRYIIAQLFHIDANLDIPDIHQQGKETINMMSEIKLTSGIFSFYKSHILDHPSIECSKILMIYRHPLDVFFSSLNYFKLHNYTGKFINGIVKSVDKIVEDNELEYYFKKYCDNLGEDFFEPMLSNRSNYRFYLSNALSNPKVIPIKYEDIIDDPVNAVSTLFLMLLPDEVVSINSNFFDKVDAKTKYSNNAFFWKAKKNTFLDYLNEDEIKYFFDKNPYFKELGY